MALSAEQWKFIAARLVSSTDKAAASIAGVADATVSRWKSEQPDFAAEYEAAFTDGIHVAQEYTRKLLGQAAVTLGESLTAERPGPQGSSVPDQQARLKAVELLFRTHNLLSEKRDVNLSGGLSVSADELILAAIAARKPANNPSS